MGEIHKKFWLGVNQGRGSKQLSNNKQLSSYEGEFEGTLGRGKERERGEKSDNESVLDIVVCIDVVC